MSVAGALVAAGGIVSHDDFRVLTEGPLHEKLATLRERREQLNAVPSDGDNSQADRKASATSLVAVIDAYMAAISSAPEGGKRSTLTTAVLREGLHLDSGYPYVLLVRGQGGDAGQLVNDRPLWWKDKFSTIASMSISYLLVDTHTGRVHSGGTESATCAIHGSIGSDFRLDPATG
jgi:hypothetical protein